MEKEKFWNACQFFSELIEPQVRLWRSSQHQFNINKGVQSNQPVKSSADTLGAIDELYSFVIFINLSCTILYGSETLSHTRLHFTAAAHLLRTLNQLSRRSLFSPFSERAHWMQFLMFSLTHISLTILLNWNSICSLTTDHWVLWLKDKLIVQVTHTQHGEACLSIVECRV